MKNLVLALFLAISLDAMAFSKKKPVDPMPTPVETATPTPTVTPKPPVGAMGSLEDIKALAMKSPIANYSWKDRGRTPAGYVKGTALVWAKLYCHQDSDVAKVMGEARKLPESTYDVTDVLSWYNSNFKALGLNSDTSGVETMMNTMMIVWGLGPRESSGKYCCGRDMSADFDSADSAEAGTYQSSYGSKRASPALEQLFKKYQSSTEGCFLDVFKEGVSASYCAGQAKNWGDPSSNGYKWQAMIKQCPAAGSEWAGILVRKSGGTRGEYGPLRKKQAELKIEVRHLLVEINKYIDTHPGVCTLL